MIKGNTVFFGYGTIAVDYSDMELIYTEIKPPQEVGKLITDKSVEYLKDVIIPITYKDYLTLLNDLNAISSKKDKTINIGQYVLDFNKYNKESIRVVLECLRYAVYWYQMKLAC